MYHDFTCHALNPNYPVGQVPGLDILSFPADEKLAFDALDAAEQVHPGHARMGRIASGDQFVAGKEQKNQIVSDTGALCMEMEGCAIAHAAWRNEVPFVVIRAISDKADDSAQIDYPTFESAAAERSARVTQALAKKLL
jgi:adenosylhomocysteine nucleosidase